MKKEESKTLKKNIVKSSFWTISSAIINRIGTLAFTILLARYLLPEGYGIYSLVMAVAMIFYTFTDFGINEAFVRHLSLAISSEKKKISAYYQYFLKIKIFFALLSSGLLIMVAYPLAKYVFSNSPLAILFILSSFYILIMSLDSFFTKTFYAITRVKYTSLKETILQISRIALVIVVFKFVPKEFYLLGIILAISIIYLLLLVISFLYFKKNFSLFYKPTNESIDTKKIKKFIGFLTLASISTILLSNIDSLILGAFLPPVYLGYYRAAFSLILGITGIVGFPSIVLLPFLSKLNNNLPKTKQIFNKAFNSISVLAIPMIFGLIALGGFFINTFYGAEYFPSITILYILAPIIYLSICTGLFLSLFSANAKPQIFARAVAITSIVNIILNIVFIKLFWILGKSEIFAVYGVALATLISWMLYFILTSHSLYKYFKINIFNLTLLKSLIAGLIMFAALIILESFITNITLLLGILLILAGIVIYSILIILLKGASLKEMISIFQ